LRALLVNIGLTKEEAALFVGQSARAGGVTEAAVKELHQENIQHLAGVSSAKCLSWYKRRYLAERLRVSRAIGL
jgi:type II secretory pathway component PulM